MCVNYTPPKASEIKQFFNAELIDEQSWKAETWQDYLAPIIKGDGSNRTASVASYGFVPKAMLHENQKRLTTMNARIETVGQKRTYSKFWKLGQLCLVPMLNFYEPNWETGKHVRWRIGMEDGSPFAVAGFWRSWTTDEGEEKESFTQLTMNADDHPLMRRFHRPNSEKRSLIIIPQTEWDEWLMCRDPERALTFAQPFPASLMTAEPAPRESASSAKKTA